MQICCYRSVSYTHLDVYKRQHRLSVKFNKLWVVAEIVLFVLVGATLDIKYAVSAGVLSIILILGVLVFRMPVSYTHLDVYKRQI